MCCRFVAAFIGHKVALNVRKDAVNVQQANVNEHNVTRELKVEITNW